MQGKDVIIFNLKIMKPQKVKSPQSAFSYVCARRLSKWRDEYDTALEGENK